ncbi:MAG TPA: hypothetical protein VFU98_05490 [Microlunatus sp.]|nr:hypothetical protein [Microlunatus sp.]
MSVPVPAPVQPRKGVAVPAAIGVVVAAMVAVFAVVGLVVSLTSDRLPTGPALAPPAPAEPEVSYDSLVRRARFANVSVSMPATPYECPSSPGSAPPILASGLICSAPVHEDYAGTDDWSATAGFGSVPDTLTRPTAAETARAVFDRLQMAAFPQEKTTITDRKTEEATLNGQQVPVLSGNVHYSVAGVPSRYDRMVVVALPVDGGGFAVYFSSRPNDTAPSTLDVLNSSIGSLRFDQ